MSSGSPFREVPGAALTCLRLGIAEHMARQAHDEESIAEDMALFVTADVLDGAILRKYDLDTPTRRAVDGVVDHLSVGRVMVEVARNNPASRPYIGILATRGIVVGSLNLLHLAETGEVTKGRSKQKATNLAMATFGVAAAAGNRKLTHLTGAIASTIAVVTAASHFKDLGVEHDSDYREL